MANLISIGQLIDQTWDIYSKNFKPLMKISAWGFLVGVFVLLRLFLLPGGETDAIAGIVGGNPEQATVLGFAIALTLSIIAIPVTSIWIYMNLVRATDRHINKKPYTFKELSRMSWHDYFSYLWVMILKSVASAAPILCMVPGVLILLIAIFNGGAGVTFNSIGLLLTFAGTIAAAVLATWLSIRLTFSGYAMLLDGSKGTHALKMSFGVTDGRFWASFWRILIPKIVFGAGVVLMEIVLAIVLPLLIASFFNLGETFGLYAGMLVTVALTTGIRVLYPPVFIIADQLLYGSLKSTQQ